MKRILIALAVASLLIYGTTAALAGQNNGIKPGSLTIREDK